MRRMTDIIDPKTAKTIGGLFRERVRRTPRACAYRRFNADKCRFENITWEEACRLAARWQLALEREGLVAGDRVAVALRNCLEWALFDLAALGLGLVTVPIFANDRPENAAHILNETGSRLLLIEDEEQWLRIQEMDNPARAVERIVVMHPIADPDSNQGVHSPGDAAPKDTDASRRESIKVNPDGRLVPRSRRDPRISDLAAWLPQEGGEYGVKDEETTDLATIVFTSGTTGPPKGVMLSHGNMLENAYACLQRESVYPDDLFLSFLPLFHTLERTVGYYLPMMAGACVAYARSIDRLADDLLEIKPTVLISVPRIYERINKKIVEGLEGKPALIRHLFRLAVNTGWRRFQYLQGRAGWNPVLLLWPLLKAAVARRVVAGFGGQLRLSVSGGAALALPIMRVFIGMGLNLLQGYGLTETSPVISVNTTDDNVPTSVGRLLPGVESLIAGNGELLVRGPNVMLGYWHNKEGTDAAINAQGYFSTGDVVQMDEAGRLSIIGRLKEIIVLSTGEKVPPEDLELAIAVNPLFEQVMVVGEGKPYLAALVVLNRPRWEKMAASYDIPSDGLDLHDNGGVESILLSEIARNISRFPGFAQIRRVHASLSPWSMQDELVTPTLKLKRKKLLAKFEKIVNLLFKGH
jgi:long-chain acyl-CoA synthetase